MANKVSMKLDGAEEVKADFESFGFSGRKAVPKYLDLISQSAISLLRENTPKDTEELANSWTVLERGSDYVVIGVPDEEEGLLGLIISGTTEHDIIAKPGHSLGPINIGGELRWFKKVHVRGVAPNDFVTRVDSFIHQMMNETMSSLLLREHRFWAPVSGKSNLGKIVGQTGVTYNRRRQFGRHGLIRPRTGLLSSRVRIGRRRRVGKIANTKRIQLG